MFKTILKTVALSAATLTLLSACGATDALNAAIRAYELNQQAGLNESGSEEKKGVLLSVEEDDEEYLPAVLAQVDESLLPSQSAEFAEIEIVREELVADDNGLAEFEEQRIAGEARLEEIEKQLIAEDIFRPDESPTGRQPTAEESRAVKAQPIIEIEEQPIKEKPITEIVEQPITKKTRLAEIEKQRIAEETRLAEIEKQRIAEVTRSIQTEYHAPGSRLTQVASIRVSGRYYDNGTIDYINDDTQDIRHSKTQDRFSLTKDADDDNVLIMKINGVEYDLIPEVIGSRISNSEYGHKTPISTYFIARGMVEAGVKEIISGTHATVQGDYVEYVTDSNDYTKYQGNASVDHTRGFATIGIQTPASVVAAQTAVATYKGTAYLDVSLAGGNGARRGSYRGIRGVWTWTDSRVSMTVDFDANTILGTASVDNNNFNSHEKIIFHSAPIVGNGFAGSFTMNEDLRTRYSKFFGEDHNITGQYGGNFFGPNADDLAGVMRFDNATTNNVAVVGIGGFRADRQ